MPYADPDKRRAYHQEYHRKHRDEIVKRAGEWQRSHRERFNATKRKMYHNNITVERERSRKYHADNLDVARNAALKRKYGITLDEYGRLVIQQCGACAICGRVRSEEIEARASLRRLVVDHDHQTGQIRGLICHRCNHALGLFGDNARVVANAAEYMS